jgi:DNA-binding GntR family transcriptional regulator
MTALSGAERDVGDMWGDAIAAIQPRQGRAARRGTGGLILHSVAIEATLTSRAYDILRKAIADMPIYDGSDEDCRLDERTLAEELGISRTPVREALLRLESEGIVRTVPRKGIYVIRKTKEEIIDVILASAGLEATAARLAAERATDDEIKEFVGRFPQFGSPVAGRQPIPLSEYSQLNLDFHQRLVELAHSELFSQLISRLQIHMRAIRHRTIGDDDRMAHSTVDHVDIIEALMARDADAVEDRVRRHALDLAEHVRLHVSHLK